MHIFACKNWVRLLARPRNKKFELLNRSKADSRHAHHHVKYRKLLKQYNVAIFIFDRRGRNFALAV